MIRCICIHLCPHFPQNKQDLSNKIPVQDIVTHKTIVSTSIPLGFPIRLARCHMAWVHKSFLPSWWRLGTTTHLPPGKSYVLASPKCLTADWVWHSPWIGAYWQDTGSVLPAHFYLEETEEQYLGFAPSAGIQELETRSWTHIWKPALGCPMQEPFDMLHKVPSFSALVPRPILIQMPALS